MEAVDRDYWNKCIDKVMKEAEQYLIYDGIIAPPMDTSSTENDETPNSIVSVTISSLPNTRRIKRTKKQLKPAIKKRSGLRLRQLVVQQCTKDLISPAELSKTHGVSIRTVQKWVTSSGARLPLKYKKKLVKVSIPTNDQPSCSSSISATTFGDHNYTRTDFNFSTAVQKVKLDPCTKKSLCCPVPMCKFETSRKNCLDNHIKSHISCEQCGKVFPGKPKLAVHMTTHKQKKKPVCMFCNREFNDKSNRWRHEKICKKRPEGVKLLGQEGNKPFKCNECDKAFYHKQYMKAHKKKFHNQNDAF